MSNTTESTDVVVPSERTNTATTKSLKDFKILQKIGGGAEGAVYLANCLGTGEQELGTEEQVAIKCIVCRTEEDIIDTRRELDFLMDLKHKNIVDHKLFFDEVKKSFLGTETRFYLVMELCPDGSLEDLIAQRKKENQPFSAETILDWTYQICECMSYLHENDIIHRDIKSENILLKDDKKTIKICDFGFVRRFDSVMTGTVLGTVVYMAPEIFNQKRYGESVDIWSIGVVVLQLLLLKSQKEIPDVRLDVEKNSNYIQELLKDEHPKIASITEGCLKIDPADRPTASEIMELIKDEKTTRFKPKKHHVRQTDASASNQVAKSDSKENGSQVDPLSIITTQKASKFWADNSWSELLEVDWLVFKEKYQQYIGYKRVFKVEERGFKKLLCEIGSDGKREVVTCYKFNDCTERAGFPFDPSLLHKIEMYTEISDSADHSRNYEEPMDPQEFEAAREKYLNMIINHDRIFIDPISQETLSVDQHCAPLKLVTDEELSQLLRNEHDMDYEDDKLLRLERLGQFTDTEQHENAITFLVSIPKAHRYIVLGAAAAGKTCLMRLLMYKAALKAKEDRSRLIPIFVPIANLSSFNHIPDFKLRCIRASADSMMNQSLRYPDMIEHFLIAIIKHQHALLLLDGLDEAATLEDKRSVEYSVGRIGTGLNGIIITSRVSGFESDEEGRSLFEGYTLARIQPLSYHVQIQIAQKREITDKSFFELLKGKYQELGKTPLLLSLMIQEFKQSNSLPEVRADLYGQAINTMFDIYFKKTNQTGAVTKKKSDELRNFLRNLACQLHHSRKRDFKDDLIKGDSEFSATWNDLKKHIDEGKFSLVVVLNGKYRFSHLSFQEYFVASTWANSKEESEIRHYERQFLRGNILTFNGERIKQLILDPWYRETFFLCAGAMGTDDFLKFAKLLLKLYRKQGGLIDSIVYGMLKERPESEKDKQKEIDKLLNNEKKVKALVEGLTHDSEDLREMALGQMKLYRKNNRITKDLIKFLGDNNEAKRNYAATALSLFIPKGDLGTRDKLLDLLNDNNTKIKEKAAYVLGNVGDIGDDDIIIALLKAVTDSDAAAANAAIDAVCKISNKGDEKVISKMLEQLTKPSTRAAASHGLGVIASKNDQKAISSLLAICNDCVDAAVAVSKLCDKGDATTRKMLIDCLKDINLDDVKLLEALDHCSIKSKSDEVIDTLIEEMKTPKRRIAYRMAYAFGSVCLRGDPLAISKLLDCLQDKSLRDKAATALGLVSDIGNEMVIDQLLTILADKATHFIVREQAAIALSKITKKGDKRVITALCDRMGDAEEVINACADALEIISDKDNTQVLDAFLLLTNHPDSGVVERAIQILGRISSRGNQSITDALLAKLKNDTLPETLRSLCAQSLGQVANFNSEQVLEVLTGFALKEESSYVRRYCLDAIGILVDNRENEKITNEIFNMLKTEETSSPIIEHGVATLARICNIATMIDQLKSKSFRSMKPIIFDIVVKAIRILRNANPNWKLDQAQIDVLSQFKSLESTFILLENAG